MGRATRWFRGLLGGKSTAVPDPRPGKEKSRWGFFKSFREREKGQQQQRQPQPQPQPPLRGEMTPPAARVSEERKGSYRETGDPLPSAGGDERSKHAIAVAAATAAVADAAVAAAHAAAAVVRLTSSGRCVTRFRGANREWAAVKIQAAFRGYLARRALKALKGLVKLQALVRGNIVRKQAAETLRCMHALVRVQARARACRALRSERSRPNTGSLNGPQTPEKYELAVRSSASRADRPCTLKRNPSKPASTNVANSNREQSSGWNWLDQWMEERYWDGRGAPAMAGVDAAVDDEKNAKILEIDSGRPQFNQKRRSNHRHSSCSTLVSDQNNSRSFTTAPDSPSKDSTTAQQSASSPSSVDMQQSPGPLRFPVMDLGESPQFYSASSSRPGSSRRGPFTPSKSECARSLFGGYPDYPNYMANTESSKAKVRSQSAPRQRAEFEKSRSLKRLSAAHGSGQQPPVVAPSAQRPSLLHSKFANKAYPGSGRLDRLGMPIRI